MKCDRCGKDNPAEVHTCTPLALKLADKLEQQFPTGTAQHYLDGDAAAELRRLHEVNEALRAQNKEFRDVLAAACDSLGAFVSDHGWSDLDMQIFDSVCAVLAQAGELK